MRNAKIQKTIISKNAACTANQAYMLGTFNLDGTPQLLTHVSATFIQGPPDGMVIGVMASEQPKTAENIIREKAFSLNHCNVAMRGLADSAWWERTPDANDENTTFYRGNVLNVPILDISPHTVECKILQSSTVGNTIVFISEIVCVHADGRFISPYPESDDYYAWYESQDAKNIDPLLYAFKYYTVSESIGKIGIAF